MRFGFLLASTVAHAMAFFAMAFTRPPTPVDVVDPAATDVDLWASPSESGDPAGSVGPVNPSGMAMAAAMPSRTTSALRFAVSKSPSVPDEPTAPRSPKPADSDQPWSLARPAPYDLGIGTYWKSVATNAGGGPSSVSPEEPPRPSAPSLDRTVRDALDAHDRALGLGREGPLMSAAREAASPSFAPDVGSAELDIESDSTGKVISAYVVSASGEVSAWKGVARELVRLMSSKPLRPTRNGRGLRTHLRIVAERTLPSGAAYARSAGPAVPEEACAGQPDPRLAGLGRKCLAGMPTGAKQTFDLADVGAKPSRVVHVHFLGEAEP